MSFYLLSANGSYFSLSKTQQRFDQWFRYFLNPWIGYQSGHLPNMALGVTDNGTILRQIKHFFNQHFFSFGRGGGGVSTCAKASTWNWSLLLFNTTYPPSLFPSRSNNPPSSVQVKILVQQPQLEAKLSCSIFYLWLFLRSLRGSPHDVAFLCISSPPSNIYL